MEEDETLIVFKGGYVELYSWLEIQGDKIVGMGLRKEYDHEGKLISAEIKPTGATATMQ